MIRLEKVSKTYQTDKVETLAVQDIDLHVRKGEFVCMMGPSGCGKSTLLNLIGLLDRPGAGLVHVDGVPITSYRDKQVAAMRNTTFGFIFQSFHLINDVRVIDNVELPLLYRGMPGAERRRLAREALEKVGLGARIDHYPNQLSGGQQQRVAIARAIVGRPQVLLADEPTGNLDSKMGAKFMEILLALNAEGTTVVMVSQRTGCKPGQPRGAGVRRPAGRIGAHMFRHYLLTAYQVFMRRKLFTAIKLACIVLMLVVLMVVAAMLQTAFYPSGVEGKSSRFLQVMVVRTEQLERDSSSTSLLGFKLVEKYLKPMKSPARVAAATMPRSVAVYQEGRATELEMRRADAEYWKILDFTLLAGRLPDAQDDDNGRMVAVLNQSSATRLFGAEPAVGKSINVGGQQLRVIGVVQDEMHMNAYADLWAPITSAPSSDYRQHMAGEFVALLLARSAADLPAIKAEVKALAASITLDESGKPSRTFLWADNKLDLFARLTIGDADKADAGSALLLGLLIGAMLAFMLLPALNLVNLNAGRIMERSAEIGVRKAFGATSAQLVRQLVLENVLLCLAGGALGMLCAKLVLLWLESSGLIPYLKVGIDLPVLGYGLVLTLVFGLLSGILPAWKMSRLDPVHALKGSL